MQHWHTSLQPANFYSVLQSPQSYLFKHRISYRKSVPSVHHTPVLWKNDGMQRDAVSPSGSPASLVFWCQEWLIRGWPCPCKIWVQRDQPPAKTAELYSVHISLRNSRTVIDSKESSIKANRKSTMDFPTSHQPRSCISPNFPKMGLR